MDRPVSEAVPLARRETKLARKSDTSLQVGTQKRTSLRVLVVDDEPDNVDCLAMLLGHLGHEVCTVYDGPEAVAAATAFQPQVILLDIQMPRMDGYQVARLLRQQPEFQQVLLVAVTGYARESDRQEALGAGFDHHLAKPFSFEALQALLAQVSEPPRGPVERS